MKMRAATLVGKIRYHFAPSPVFIRIHPLSPHYATPVNGIKG
jgi:hypothetical protein